MSCLVNVFMNHINLEHIEKSQSCVTTLTFGLLSGLLELMYPALIYTVIRFFGTFNERLRELKEDFEEIREAS